MASFCPNTRLTPFTVHRALRKISRMTGGAAVPMEKLLTYLSQNGYVDFWTVSLETEVDAALHHLVVFGRVISPQPGYFLPTSVQSGWNGDPIKQPHFAPPIFDPPQMFPSPPPPKPNAAPVMMNLDPNGFQPPMPPPFAAYFPPTPPQPAVPIPISHFQSPEYSPEKDRPAMAQPKRTQTTSLVPKEQKSSQSGSTESTTTSTTSTTGTATTTLTGRGPSDVSTATASDELPRVFRPLNVPSGQFDQFIGNLNTGRVESTGSGARVETKVG